MCDFIAKLGTGCPCAAFVDVPEYGSVHFRELLDDSVCESDAFLGFYER